MKSLSLSKTARLGVLAIMSGVSVSAQSGNTGSNASQPTKVERDNDTDWGLDWLAWLAWFNWINAEETPSRRARQQ